MIGMIHLRKVNVFELFVIGGRLTPPCPLVPSVLHTWRPEGSHTLKWRRGSDLELNGVKWWTTGACMPTCAICIFMGKTNPSAAPHRQQSMVLVPMDTPGKMPGSKHRRVLLSAGS